MILLAVEIDVLIVSPLPRPMQLHRDFGKFQQSRNFFIASIPTARNINVA